MASSIIQEFLVSLGFKTNESGLKNFVTGIGKATKTVLALAAAIDATAGTVAAGIARWASNLEALYFAAQRTGSSAISLKALDLAARNLGASSGEAQEAVEGLAAALRINPGNVGLLTGLLAKLGYQLKVNADGSIDSADALIKLSQVFKSMPYFQAKQFADLLNISEHTLYQLTHGNLVDEYTKALKELSAGGFDKAAEHAHEFMIELRDLQAQFEVFVVQVADAIQQKLKFNLEDLRHWLEKNGPQLALRFADTAKQMIDAAIWIADKLTIVVDKLKEWDQETDGLSTKLIALAVLLKVSGAGSVIGGVLSLAAAFGRVAGAISLVRGGLIALSGYGLWKMWQAANDDQHLQPGQTPAILKIKEWINKHLPDYAKVPEGILLNNPGNLEYRNQPGAAQMGRWAAFASEGEGLYQLGRQIELYGSRGINSVSSIISKFAPPGENNTAAYIADVSKRLGVSADQSLSLTNPTLLANLMNAITLHEQGVNPYSSDLVKSQAQNAIAAHIRQENTFHLATSDPTRAADQIDARLKQINSELVRSFGLLAQ